MAVRSIFLTIRERLAIPTMLPQSFSLTDWKSKFRIVDVLKFSEDEIAKKKITADPAAGNVSYEPSFEDHREEFAMVPEDIDFIKECVRHADAQHTLNDFTAPVAAMILDDTSDMYDTTREA